MVRCLWILRREKQLVGGAVLYNLTQQHEKTFIAHPTRLCHIVRDNQNVAICNHAPAASSDASIANIKMLTPSSKLVNTFRSIIPLRTVSVT